jgi:type II secretory pathway pseudopilin PulG
MRTVIQIILAVIIIILAYLVVESIMEPIRFNKAKDIREKATISRLIDIREAQKAYKDVNLKYTGSFDTLINFLQTGQFELTKAEGTIPESLIDSVGIKKAKDIALKRGIIRREITKISVKDSLFGESYPVDSLRFVPFCGDLNFDIVADEFITPSKLTIKVVRVSVPYDKLLKGLDPQLVVNYTDERSKITGFGGLKFGSLDEGTLTGNWE